ncbi:hypothetical protein TNCV_3711041 [Trichonephila clavipes]|uniref:Uncharacterized protein n=1 Tax=Trichonephila clavipes TaxID=2585209 RepID=A0A8X6UZG1_TRICX|nr:hypothetical protein TNCV_3711041 [Trichonephila clavipes]
MDTILLLRGITSARLSIGRLGWALKGPDKLDLTWFSAKYFAPEKGFDPLHQSGHFEGDILKPKFIELHLNFEGEHASGDVQAPPHLFSPNLTRGLDEHLEWPQAGKEDQLFRPLASPEAELVHSAWNSRMGREKNERRKGPASLKLALGLRSRLEEAAFYVKWTKFM